MFTFAEKLKQMSNIEHKDVGVSSLKGTPSKKIYIKTSTEAVYNPEGVTQEYINNHVDGSKIVDGTVTNNKIANGAVSMNKLDNETQTLIQRGADSSWTPKGDFNIETTYDANDVVFDPVTNSSYLSLRADNTGHPVNENDEEYEEGWWMKVLDGSYVNRAIEEMESAIAQAIEDAQEDIDDAITGANTAAQAANTAAANAEAKIDWVEEQVDSLTAYEVATALDETSIIPVQNKVVTGAIGVGTEINLSSVLPYYQRVIISGKWIKLTNRYGRFLPVEVGDVYKITASNLGTCVYGVLADNYCDVGIAPDYAEGYSAMASIPANNTREVAINATNAKYLYIETSATGTAGRPPAKVIKTNGVIREDVNANTKDITKINNELFTQELFDIAYADVTASLPTSYMTVTRNGKEITMTITQTSSAHRVILNSPTYNLVSGVRYRITFDINNQTGKTAYIRWANNTNPATGAFGSIPNGYNGSKSYEFVWGQGTSSTFSFSVGNAAAGATLVINNISIVNVTPTENIKTNETDIAALDVRVTHLEVGDTPQATTKSEYVGDVFPVPKKHYIGSTRLAYGGASNYKQGADQYNGYVFQFDDFNRSLFHVFIYDLSQPAFLTTVTPTRLSTFHAGAHCNEVCFSRKFYDPEDTFPLLYVSSGASAIYNYAQVYRIQQSGNTFTITQVQEIAFPATIGGVTVQWMQIYIDNERNAIWQTYATGGKYRFTRYAIPATTEENVTLTESNILETFDTEHGSSNQQGGVIYDNKLYLAIGSSTDDNPPAIDVFDLSAKCKIVRGFNLRALGVFTGELESVFFYEDNMYGIGQGMDGVYRFYFGG